MDGEAIVGYSPRGCKESDMTEKLHFFSFSLCGDEAILMLHCGGSYTNLYMWLIAQT